jgi:O-antigen/teichoic acid export membrane protein
MGLGFAFFIIQVCSLIIYSTSNVIITQIFSPSEVVVYNIAFRYFSVITLFFGIITVPFWSAFTEAYAKQDITWIKRMAKKLVVIWLFFCFGAVLMVLLSDFIYGAWVGKTIDIPIQVTVVMAVYVCIVSWNSIFYAFNSSMSKMYIQIRLSLLAGIVFIPLAFGLSKKIGLAGIPVAMGLSIMPGSFISPVQFYKLANKKAKGNWNK